MKELAVEGCNVCGRTQDGVRIQWTRAAPDYARLALCTDCTNRYRGWAEDRGDEALEQYRVVDLARRLGGEVWRVDDSVFWFREPLPFPREKVEATRDVVKPAMRSVEAAKASVVTAKATTPPGPTDSSNPAPGRRGQPPGAA